MDDPIISLETIRTMARKAYARDVPRDGHNMNWHARAIETWQAEWDLCAAAETAMLKVKPMLARAGVTPP